MAQAWDRRIDRQLAPKCSGNPGQERHMAATTARLGFRPQDVAETVGMDARRFRRIRTGKYEVPDWLAERPLQEI